MVELRVVYDNRTLKDELEPDWGFACVVDIGEQRILFDTGAKPEVLLANLQALAIEPLSIDCVVISHNHWDHFGGLEAILKAAQVECWIPGSAAEELGARVKAAGGKPRLVKDRVELCPGVWSTGEMGSAIREQGLVIDAKPGPVLVAGCAHPGIVDMAERAKLQSGRPPYLVLGGFHLGGTPAPEVEQVIRELKTLGVSRVGPAHCTGDEAIGLFSSRWPDGFERIGCGWSTRLELK
jgi:7,8-dihydropterin-6-yl-methyl-4-(beta-D-ribofuranosyl)aminobenzene 5'-phosphate synthase